LQFDELVSIKGKG